ncbi:hypothetical protein ACFL1Z_01625 [Thermodesulfobacteriota bacterium]
MTENENLDAQIKEVIKANPILNKELVKNLSEIGLPFDAMHSITKERLKGFSGRKTKKSKR